MSRNWLLAIGAGLVSALIFGLLTTGLPLAIALAYFVQLPIFLAGLGLGVLAGVGAGATGLVALAAADGVAAAAFYVTIAIPAVIMVQRVLLARRNETGEAHWYPPGMLAIWLAGLAIAGLGVAMVALSGEPGGLEGVMQQAVEASRSELKARFPELQGGDPLRIARVLPGLVLCSWMLMTLLNGGIAQSLLRRAGHNIRPLIDIAELELPRWVPIALAAALGLAVLGDGWPGYLGVNVTAIIAFLFFLSGIAVIHAMVRRRDTRQVILIFFYALLVIFFLPAILVVVALGLIEQWAQLRRRFLAQV